MSLFGVGALADGRRGSRSTSSGRSRCPLCPLRQPNGCDLPVPLDFASAHGDDDILFDHKEAQRPN